MPAVVVRLDYAGRQGSGWVALVGVSRGARRPVRGVGRCLLVGPVVALQVGCLGEVGRVAVERCRRLDLASGQAEGPVRRHCRRPLAEGMVVAPFLVAYSRQDRTPPVAGSPRQLVQPPVHGKHSSR